MTSFTINVDSNYKEVASLLSEVGEKVLTQARVSATNKAVTQTRTQIRRDVTRDTGVPAGFLNKRFHTYRATYRKPEARMFIGTMPFSAYKLGIRELKRGGVSIRGAGGRETVGSAFVAKMPSGHTGVFKRKTSKRLPIKELKVYVREPVRRAAERHLTTLGKNFERLFASDFNFRTQREITKRRLR